MKKFKFFALAALLGMSINVMAQEKSTDTFTYTVSGNDATITGFVNGLSNSQMATVSIPATIKGSGSKTYNVVAIDGTKSESTTFKGNAKIKKVILEANSNLKEIKEKSFQGASNLATVTLTNGSKLEVIEAAAFEGTALTQLDLTPTVIKKLNPIFIAGAGTSSATKNKKLTTVKLPATLTNVMPYAFQNCMQLASLDFSKCNKDLEIGANAFDNCLFFNELELPACVARIADYALDGSRIETLTINANSGSGKPTIGFMDGDKLTSIIVNGAFQGKFGEDNNGDPITVSTSVTSVTFNGAVKAGAIAAGAFVDAANLATVTFNSTLEADAVAAGAFGDDTGFAGSGVKVNGWWVGMSITYAPEEAAAAKKKSFNEKAFASDGTWGKRATLLTATWYKAWIDDLTNYSNGIYSLDISAAPETIDVEVANNGEGKYYYATFCEKGDYKIAAKQGEGENEHKVMVYSAYVDETENGSWDNQVYMEQLTLYGGYYWIPSGTPVIVKSTTEDDVVATLATNSKGFNSLHQSYNTKLGYYTANNAIRVVGTYFTDESIYGIELKEYVEWWWGNKYVPYILAPIEEYGLYWSKFSDTRVIPANTFFVVANNASKEYAPVIWTDGSEEEATAIQNVKNANAENGAQYNLAGQKVNAAYKGIIIKDGKKMIQK